MKHALKILLILLLLAGCGAGYLYHTGWFQDPQVALRELEKLGISPTESEAFAAIGRDDAATLSTLHRAGISMREALSEGNAPIHQAIMDERWVTATALLDFDIDVNARNAKDAPALQLAIEKHNLALAKYLLEHGASPDTLFDSGEPALIDAVKRADAPTMAALLEAKADPNIANSAGETPIFLALQSGNAPLVTELLKAGASANTSSPQGQPLLNYLCQHFQTIGLEDADAGSLLEQLLVFGADIDAADPSGKHSLRHALEQRFTSGAQALLTRVEDVSGTLWVALPQGDETVIHTLVKKGADVNEARSDGETPLTFAVREKKADLARFFIDHGADMLAPGKEGQAAIPLAIVLGDTATTMALITHEKAPEPDTFLEHPVSDTFRKLVKSALLDFYLRNTHDITPLMCAVCLDQEEVLLKLIELGANRFAPTAPRKVYPIQLAAKRKNVRIQQILIGVPHEDHEQRRRFVIDLSKQRVTYYKDGEKVRTGSISSGRRSNPTIPGEYVITDKSRMHYSNLYNSAKMPYFQRFSCTAMGFHTGALPGYPASHGCVRLANSTAKFFFKESKVGDRVSIVK